MTKNMTRKAYRKAVIINSLLTVALTVATGTYFINSLTSALDKGATNQATKQTNRGLDK